MSQATILTIIGHRETDRLSTLATPASKSDSAAPTAVVMCPKCEPSKVVKVLSADAVSRTQAQVFVSADPMAKPAEMYVLEFPTEPDALTWLNNRAEFLVGKQIYLHSKA